MASIFKKIGRTLGLTSSKDQKQLEHLSRRATEFEKNILKIPGYKEALKTLYKAPSKDMKTFTQGLQKFIQPSEKQMMKEFQAGIVDPMTKNYLEQIVPQTLQKFAGGTSGSSALNRALQTAATGLSTNIYSQLPAFMQQQRANQLQALSALPTYRSAFYSPMMQALATQGSMATGAPLTNIGGGGFMSSLGSGLGSGAASGLASLLASGGGASGVAAGSSAVVPAALAALSSIAVKENVKEYSNGFEELKKLKVKSYDYKPGFGDKNRIGLIAEEVPEEIKTNIDGINAVDIYGLVSLLINSVKELGDRIERLESNNE